MPVTMSAASVAQYLEENTPETGAEYDDWYWFVTPTQVENWYSAERRRHSDPHPSIASWNLVGPGYVTLALSNNPFVHDPEIVYQVLADQNGRIIDPDTVRSLIERRTRAKLGERERHR